MLEILHEVHPLFVSRETALFRQAILRVLTKKHGCTPFTLCSHQTCGCIQNPGFRIQPYTVCVWLDGKDTRVVVCTLPTLLRLRN